MGLPESPKVAGPIILSRHIQNTRNRLIETTTRTCSRAKLLDQEPRTGLLLSRRAHTTDLPIVPGMCRPPRLNGKKAQGLSRDLKGRELTTACRTRLAFLATGSSTSYQPWARR